MYIIRHKTNLDNMYQGSDPNVNTDAKGVLSGGS
jgi:hypothetical protein